MTASQQRITTLGNLATSPTDTTAVEKLAVDQTFVAVEGADRYFEHIPIVVREFYRNIEKYDGHSSFVLFYFHK